MLGVFPCFVQFRVTDVEVFAGSGDLQNPHVGYLIAKLTVLHVAHWAEHLPSVYLIQDTSVGSTSCFFFLDFNTISLLSRKALKLAKQYFISRLLHIKRCV